MEGVSSNGWGSARGGTTEPGEGLSESCKQKAYASFEAYAAAAVLEQESANDRLLLAFSSSVFIAISIHIKVYH